VYPAIPLSLSEPAISIFEYKFRLSHVGAIQHNADKDTKAQSLTGWGEVWDLKRDIEG